jgi:putative ABC transport system permease protein
MSILRNLVRRRLRTLLTVLGVGIAVFGLVVLGALSERMRLHVENGDKYYGDYAWITDRIGFFGIGSRLDEGLQDDIEAVPGVEYAARRAIVVPLEEDDIFSATPWDMSALVGLDLDERRCILREMRLLEGRQMEPGVRGQAILGYAAAEKYAKSAGDRFRVRDLELEVVGVLDLIGTDPDSAVFTSVADARDASEGMLAEGQVSAFAVRLAEGADEEAVRRGVEEVGGERLRVMMPSEIKQQVSATSGLINSMLYGCTIIAMIVGTLGTANTMTMSVGERAREIATKKAIGASTTDVFREFLTEALVISAMGAVVGVGLGLIGVEILNRVIATPGLPLFVVTWRLIAVGGVVALAVGGLAGVFPALQAARVDPVRILRNA